MTAIVTDTLLPLLATAGILAPVVILIERADRRARDTHGTGRAHPRDHDADTRRLAEDLRVSAAWSGSAAADQPAEHRTHRGGGQVRAIGASKHREHSRAEIDGLLGGPN
ncbi:MAG: hypothetical protein ACRCYX_03400 [Dermatophilaceae bacterium]